MPRRQSANPRRCGQDILAGIRADLDAGRLVPGKMLPSINEAALRFGVCRDTVVKAYQQLGRLGVAEAVHGKGFYVRAARWPGRPRVLVLLDVIGNAYKDRMWAGLAEGLDGQVDLRLQFHHHDPELVAEQLARAQREHAFVAVIPFPDPQVRAALAACDQRRLLLVDLDLDFPGKACGVLRQSHDDAMIAALDEVAPRLAAYRRVVLVFPTGRYHPDCIPPAFRRFCRSRRLPCQVVGRLDPSGLEAGTAVFVIEDDHLVATVQAANARGWRLGRDLGLLAYNDTAWKAIAAGSGISVVTTDFHDLGRRAAGRIRAPSPAHEVVETHFIDRGSL